MLWGGARAAEEDLCSLSLAQRNCLKVGVRAAILQEQSRVRWHQGVQRKQEACIRCRHTAETNAVSVNGLQLRPRAR